MPDQIRLLRGSDVDELLDLSAVVETQRVAFTSLASGEAQLADRQLLQDGDDVAFCYASRLSPSSGPVCKFGSVNPGNAQRGIAAVSAIVMLLDPGTGRVRALIDGDALTRWRTSAASVVAVQALAGQGPHTLAVLGTGVQGHAHARDFTALCDVDRIRVWAPGSAERQSVAEHWSEQFRVEVVAHDTVVGCISGADLVVAATLSRLPLIEASMLRPGATVVSVGSFAPDRREIADQALAAPTRVVADHAPIAVRQAGHLVSAISAGVLSPEDVVSLGDVLIDPSKGRQHPEEIVVYTSVGLGVQDAAAGWLAVDRAAVAGVGELAAW